MLQVFWCTTGRFAGGGRVRDSVTQGIYPLSLETTPISCLDSPLIHTNQPQVTESVLRSPVKLMRGRTISFDKGCLTIQSTLSLHGSRYDRRSRKATPTLVCSYARGRIELARENGGLVTTKSIELVHLPQNSLLVASLDKIAAPPASLFTRSDSMTELPSALRTRAIAPSPAQHSSTVPEIGTRLRSSDLCPGRGGIEVVSAS